MSRVLVLSGIKLNENDEQVITNANVFKVALNHHASHLKPDIRFTSDYIVEKIQRIDNLPVYSSRDAKGIMVNVNHSGSSLVDCCNWLKGNEILLIADNNYNTKEMQYLIKGKLTGAKGVYKFTRDGNFNLPYVSLEDFLNGNY